MIKKYLPYLGAIIVFAFVAVIYFSPVLNGDKLMQSDIQQFRGMSKEIKDFRATHNAEPYWTDAAFGGMPSYQLSTYYPNDFVKKIDTVIRFLPAPADFLFLYFLGFFVLLSVLKVDWKLAILGSLAFGFTTYFVIIIGVGHNAKAHAIGYIPLVMAGVLWVFQKKYFKGFALTTLALALEINTSHPQMTYYLMFSLLILGIVYLWDEIKAKNPLKPFFTEVGLIVLAAVLALGTNASSLLATKEYASYSTRGKSDLTITADGQQKARTNGLDKSYITEYSYGMLETFNLFIPRFTGGANSEDLGEDSKTYQFLISKIDRSQATQFSKSVPTYWGSQPIVAAPAYIGAIFVFLFVLGILLVDSKLKKWLVATTIFSIVLSWGHNFSIVTNLFIEFVPLYNKFRAVSSIQILAEIAVPLLGILALKEFIWGDKTTDEKLKALKNGFFIAGGTALFFTLLGSFFFSFTGANDAYYNSMLDGLGSAIVEDRKELFFSDSLRTFLLVLFVAVALFAFLKDKLKQIPLLLIVGFLMLFDTVTTARRYVNDDDFYPAIQVEKPFQLSPIDQEILKDKGHYRVANFMGNFMNDGATSYFHKSIGGYHAAKLGRYQDLVDFHISKNNIQVLNMLNTKYFMVPDEEGVKGLQINPDANGNAWFVHNIQLVNSANEEILALGKFNSKETAVINAKEFPTIIGLVDKIENDSVAKITLVKYEANYLKYESINKGKQLAVFSEIYYKEGWNAYVDGKLTPHYRANYVLRALEIPSGKHMVEFKFEPTIIATGGTISLVSFVCFGLLLGVGFFQYKKEKKA